MRSTDVNGESESFFKKDDLVFAYTRNEAVADGELIDVTDTAQEAGFKMNVCITRACWETFVGWSDEDTKRQTHQDEAGRLWDVLWMLRMAIAGIRTHEQGANGIESEILFEFYSVPRDRKATRPVVSKAKAVCGPTGPDDPTPCITIMLSDES